MKQSLCNICLAVATLLASSVFGWPSGWPVTNTVHHWELYDGKHDLRTVVSMGLIRTPRDYRLPRTEDMLLAYAKEHRIPVSNMVGVAQTVAEEGFAMLESGSITNKKDAAAVMRYCGILMGFMGYTKDPSALPYLELKSTSVNDDIRRTAANMIVNILGSNAIDFLRDFKKNELYRGDLYSLYESFGSLPSHRADRQPTDPMVGTHYAGGGSQP